MIGLNVGSGQRRFLSTPALEWINIDKQAREGQGLQPDLMCDGCHMPYADDTIDYVVLHHVLEHFGCGEADGLVREARRVLQPKGSLLVFVPDLRMLADRWLRGQLTTQIYMTNVYGAYMGNEEDRHKWGYDRDSLAAFLKQHTWSSVHTFNWRLIPGARFARDFWIAALECVK